jgi:hypothetical protein
MFRLRPELIKTGPRQSRRRVLTCGDTLRDPDEMVGFVSVLPYFVSWLHGPRRSGGPAVPAVSAVNAHSAPGARRKARGPEPPASGHNTMKENGRTYLLVSRSRCTLNLIRPTGGRSRGAILINSSPIARARTRDVRRCSTSPCSSAISAISFGRSSARQGRSTVAIDGYDLDPVPQRSHDLSSYEILLIEYCRPFPTSFHEPFRSDDSKKDARTGDCCQQFFFESVPRFQGLAREEDLLLSETVRELRLQERRSPVGVPAPVVDENLSPADPTSSRPVPGDERRDGRTRPGCPSPDSLRHGTSPNYRSGGPVTPPGSARTDRFAAPRSAARQPLIGFFTPHVR